MNWFSGDIDEDDHSYDIGDIAMQGWDFQYLPQTPHYWSIVELLINRENGETSLRPLFL